MRVAPLLRWTTGLLVCAGACSRPAPAPPAPPAPPAAAQPVAPPAGAPAAALPPAVEPALPASPAPSHAPPTDDEIRAQLAPLWPAVAECVRRMGEPPARSTLRFGIVAATGKVGPVDLPGPALVSQCGMSALAPLHVEPWAGGNRLVSIPLGPDGSPAPAAP